jgi:replicative DNA helicase
MSVDLLRVLGNREYYNKYIRYIKPHALSREVKQIVDGIKEYYEGEETRQEVDWSDFATWYYVKHPTLKVDDIATLNIIFDKLKLPLADGSTVPDIINQFVTRDFALQIGEVGLRVNENGGEDLDEITELLDKYNSETGKMGDDDNEAEDDIVKLVAASSRAGGLHWRLNFLDDAVGPIVAGDLVLFSARVESGKTTFIASEASHMAEQLASGDKKVLWFCNEEHKEAIAMRRNCAVLGRTAADIEANPVQAMKDYEALMGARDRIKIIHDAGLHKWMIEEKLKKYDAGLIIVDQAMYLHGFESAGSEVEKYGQIYRYLRELSARHAPVIAVHQAGGDAHGVLYPEATMLEGSRTKLQAAIDVQIMMGKEVDPARAKFRGLNVVKNKLTGKHPQGEVEILPEIARFKG